MSSFSFSESEEEIPDAVDLEMDTLSMLEDTLSASADLEEMLSVVEDETLSAVEEETPSDVEDEISAFGEDICSSEDVGAESNELSTVESKFCLILVLLFTAHVMWYVSVKCKRVKCSLHKLLQLAGGVCDVNNYVSKRSVDYNTSGCCVRIFGTCGNGHPFQWESSDFLYSEDQRKLYLDNLHFAATIVFSGNNYKKIEMLASFYLLQIVCSTSFHAYQCHYICPGINKFYECQQVFMLQARYQDTQ